MKSKKMVGFIAALMVVGWSSGARAQVEMNGYLRAAVGANTEKGNLTCFKLKGAETKYRLGNECEVYSELMLSTTAYTADDGSKFDVHFMAFGVIPTTEGDLSSFVKNGDYGYAQLYIDGTIPELGGARPWIGRRYYKREDVHVIDFFYWNPSGIGGGIEDIGIGDLKLSYALFVAEQPNNPDQPELDQRQNAFRHDIQLRGIPLIPDGELQLGASIIQGYARGSAVHSGWSGIVRYQQKLLGGRNFLAFQYGVGPGTGLSYTGDLALGSSAKRWRVVEDLAFQLTPALGGQVVVVYEDTKDTQKWLTAGGRLSFAFTEHLKLLAEAGFDHVKPDSGDTRQLTKLTIAPTIAAASGFWARPELRIFYTQAFWNRAAREAGIDTGGVYRPSMDKTSGSTFGLSVEAWW